MKKLSAFIGLLLILQAPAFAAFAVDPDKGKVYPVIGASGGSGDVSAVGDCASGACFDGTQGTTLTFNNAGGDGEMSYDGTNFTLNKPILSSSLTASRAVVTDASKILTSSATTATELGYVNGVTSAIQTQIDGKQASDADLTSIAGNTTGGFLTRTASNTYTARTFGEGLALDVTNGDGVSGAPSYAFDPTELTGSRTFGDASTDTIVWTFDRATGTDSTITSLSGGIGVQSLTNAALTSGRVTIAGTSGILQDDADFTFATDTLTVTKIAATTLTGAVTLAENSSIALDPAGSADGKYTGITVTGTGGATIAFGDLVTLDKDDSRWELVDISVAAAATGDARGILGFAVTSSTDGGAITVLLQGIIRADANFPTLTIGAPVYASTTGDVVVAQPTTTDHVIRVIGFALTADELYFAPEQGYTTHT